MKKFWEEKLGAVQFYTQNSTMDILFNRWLMCQVISAGFGLSQHSTRREVPMDSRPASRLYGRYSCGLGCRAQILLHSKHQFIEGDVQHWWHEEKYKGTRTRFSDDLLWMPM